MLDSIIQLENVYFKYPNKSSFLFHDISLQILSGQYVGILGPNGGGKSTLLKIILGLESIQSGKVQVFGQNISKFLDWHKIGYIPQYLERKNNFPSTVKEVVASSILNSFKFSKNQNELIQQALIRSKLENIQNQSIYSLSGGQLQKVFIARSLVNKPSLLILDEPTTGVDQQSIEDFYSFVRELNITEKMTILLVSHDIEIIKSQTKHVLVVKEGFQTKGLIESKDLAKHLINFQDH